MEFLWSPRRLYFGIEGEVVPNQSYFSNILPFSLHPHLIESQLPVGIDPFLGWKSIGGFVIVNFEDGIISEGQTIDEASNPISFLFFQREINIFFKAQCPSLIEWKVTFVIISDTFFSQAAVILGTVFFSYNLNHLIPILFPTLMVKVEKFFQGIEFGHLQISVKFLQGIVNPRTHEGLNAFGLSLDLFNVNKPILVGTGFVGGKLRVGVGWHVSSPLSLLAGSNLLLTVMSLIVYF
jgi:hypothetical protein